MFKDDNMNQVVLPMDLSYKLQENDVTFFYRQCSR